MRAEIARIGFEIKSLQTFGHSYALTLAEWNRHFQDAWTSIRTFGFDERFKLMWEHDLAYCEAGFRSGMIDVGLYVIGTSSRVPQRWLNPGDDQ